MKHKMWAVCYQDTDAKPPWVPFGTEIHHFRARAIGERNINRPNARVLPVMVEVVMPKRRKTTVANRGVKP